MSFLKRLFKKDYHSLNDMEEQKKHRLGLKETWRTMKALAPYFWPQKVSLRFRLIGALSLLVLSRVFSVVTPLIWRDIIDGLPADSGVVGLILLYCCIRFLETLSNDLRDFVFLAVAQFATEDVVSATFAKLHSLSVQFHLSRKTGSVLKTLSRGQDSINTLTRMILLNLAPILLEFVIVLIIVAANFGGWYSFILFCAVSAYIALTLTITEWRTKFRRETNEKSNVAQQQAVDSLINFETVRLFTAEDYETQRYRTKLGEYFAVQVKAQSSLMFLNASQAFAINAGMLALLLGAHEVHTGALTVGGFVAIQAYILSLYRPLSFLGSSYRMIMGAVTDLEALFDLLEQEEGVKDLPGASELNIDRGSIEFKDVSFTYPSRGDSSGEDRKVLDSINFSVPAGKTFAIVGKYV